MPDSPQQEQKDLTLHEYKNLRRQFFTVRRDIVKSCGHKFNPNDQPKNNCQYCWFHFLNQSADFVNSLIEAHKEHGMDVIINLKGRKFFRMFVKFMATIAQAKEQDKKVE